MNFDEKSGTEDQIDCKPKDEEMKPVDDKDEVEEQANGEGSMINQKTVKNNELDLQVDDGASAKPK